MEFSRLELSAWATISFVYPVLYPGSSFGGPSSAGEGAGLEAMRVLLNHVPYPGDEGGHLRVHIRGLGITAPEARKGDKAVGLVPAHQGPPGVCLGVDRKARSLSLTSWEGASTWRSHQDPSLPQNPSMAPLCSYSKD